jgi:hypothetical protein
MKTAPAKTAPVKATTAKPATRRSAHRREPNGCSRNERNKSFSEHENLPWFRSTSRPKRHNVCLVARDWPAAPLIFGIARGAWVHAATTPAQHPLISSGHIPVSRKVQVAGS